MSGRRTRLPGGVVAVLALLVAAAGCGEQRKNEARAPNPVQTTVRVTATKVTVSPATFNVGEAAGLERHQSAPEAEAEQQGTTVSAPTQTEPPTEMDQPVELTIVNLSNQRMNLEITGPGADATSRDIPAGGTGLLKVTLETGTYRVAARGDFRPTPAKLKIGPLRRSAQGDLLLP